MVQVDLIIVHMVNVAIFYLPYLYDLCIYIFICSVVET